MVEVQQSDDVVLVLQLDDLGRSPPEVARRMGRIAAAGAGLRSLKEGIDTATAAGQADTPER